ncbi:molecular chaperone DnaJ [Christensenellaceae bacterium OttesenSCG-928-M15]|nr:molecular chaperone DnaJ [Christensenellaceae bacterium OttesenSCG-928-M15]
MANKRDYYEVLGVEKSASESDIKSAFRKQAKTCHPDLHPGDKEAEAKFKELNEAAEVLSDSQKRAQYDQFGHAAFEQGGGGYSGGGSPFSGFGGFSDIFETMFGGGFSSSSRNTGPVAGHNLRYTLTISFEDAAFGVKREILVPREQNCHTCGGSGAKPGTQPERCTACNGTGQVRAQQNTIMGSFTTVRTCTVCNGAGEVVKEPCLDCRGEGRIKKQSRVIVNVPAGIDDGQTLNLAGEGEAGFRGGPSGDLYVNIRVKPHKMFRRNGFDLLLNMQIPFSVAALGGEIEVPTLSGKVKYNVPEGTQTGTTFRLKGQGVQRLRGKDKGDLLVKVDVEVPKRLNEEQKELLRAFGDSLGEKRVETKSGKKSIFNIVKDALNND